MTSAFSQQLDALSGLGTKSHRRLQSHLHLAVSLFPKQIPKLAGSRVWLYLAVGLGSTMSRLISYVKAHRAHFIRAWQEEPGARGLCPDFNE